MGGADADLIAIRMRLSGGSQVAGEARAAAAGVGEVGAAATASAAATARGTTGIRNSIRSVLSNSMKLRAIGRTMTYGLTLPIIGAGFFAIKTAAEFDTSMEQVKAATGVGSSELDSLRKLAIQMGADTVFSANEAAQAMLELAKGGMSAAQIRAGALDASLKLAAAGGIDLATAANQITRSMNTFHMPASKAIEIANALAGAANASSADLSDLSLAFSQAGQGAAAAGFSVQETAGVLGAFADAGIIGSDAGTSLKVMLQRLVPQSADAAAAMKQYGLDFFNANGEMKSATQIAGILQKGLGGLSQEQRAAAMQTIFGSDATRAANILMQQGAGGLARYIKATQDKEAAEKMAQARMTGLAGAIETFKGSAETAALALGEALKPVIIALAGVLTGLLNGFTALPGPVQSGIAVFLVLIALLGPLIFLLGTAAAAATALDIALGPFLLIALGIAAGIAVVIALGVAFAVLYKRVTWFHNAVNAVWGFIKSHWPLLLGPLMIIAAPLLLGIKYFRQIRGAAEWGFNGAKNVIHAVGSAIAWVIDKVRTLAHGLSKVADKAKSLLPHVDTGGGSGGIGVGVGGFGVSTEGVTTPFGKVGFATGGVLRAGSGVVGEQGLERIDVLPSGGVRVTPLEVQGSKTLAGKGLRGRDRWKQPLVFRLRGKTLAEAVVTLQEDEEARE